MPTAAMALGAAVAALALAACGGDDTRSTTTANAQAQTVDTAAVENGIEQQLSTTQAKVTAAACPKEVSVKRGSTFKCSVTWSNGATGKVEVTQEGANRYTYKPVSGSVKVPGSTVEKSLDAQLAKEGAPDAQANCPDTIIVKVGTTVTCDLNTAGGATAGTVTFTFSSDEGAVDPASVQASG